MRQEATRALFDYWTGLRAGRPAPDRALLDPAAIRALLRDMFILARGHGPTWHYRLAGTRLAALAGRELRGETFHQWWAPRDRPDVQRMLASVADDTTPLVAGVEADTIDNDPLDIELLLLPLLHEGRAGERILGGLFPRLAPGNQQSWHADQLRLISLRIVTAKRLGALARPITPTGEALMRRQRLRLIIGGRHDDGPGAGVPR